MDGIHRLYCFDDDERGICSVQYTGQVRNVANINESGLYSLIMRSRKPNDWLRHLGTRKLLLAMEENSKYGNFPYLVKSKKGRHGGTFAHPVTCKPPNSAPTKATSSR